MARTRKFGAVPCRLWRSAEYKRLSQAAKLIYLYLLTCEHANAAGVFRLPVAYAAADTGFSVEEIESAHAELEAGDLVIRCDDWVIVQGRLADDPPPNPKTFSAVCAQVNEAINDAPDELPLQSLSEDLIELSLKFPGVMPEWFIDKFGVRNEGDGQ